MQVKGTCLGGLGGRRCDCFSFKVHAPRLVGLRMLLRILFSLCFLFGRKRGSKEGKSKKERKVYGRRKGGDCPYLTGSAPNNY